MSHKIRNRRFARQVLLPAFVLSMVTVAGASAQNPPKDIKAVAASATAITLTWTDDSTDETDFYVERDGIVLAILPADTTTFTDAGLTTGTTYVYRVGSIKGGGPVMWSKKAWALPSATTEFWVVDDLTAAQFQVGYTYCEYFEFYAAGLGTGTAHYHLGVDFMRVGDATTGKKDVVAPIGGRINRIEPDIHAIEFKETGAGGAEFVLLAHVMGSSLVMKKGVDEEGWVMAGVKLGEIQNAFPDYGAHVHVDRLKKSIFAVSSAEHSTERRHFLQLYTADNLRDPTNVRPSIKDRTKPVPLDDDDERVQYKEDFAPPPPPPPPPGEYITEKTGENPPNPQPADAFILKDRVDIVLEAEDPMGHPQKPAALFKAGYWIEQNTALGNDVRSAAAPYVLHKCEPNLFKADGTQKTEDIYETSKAKHWIFDFLGEPTNDTCGHWTVTNSSDVTGAMDKVDTTQHWHTKAKEIVPPKQANGSDTAFAEKAQDAYFGDGHYKVHLLAWDLVGMEEAVDDVWVENFPPAVVMIQPNSLCQVLIDFSEPMNQTAVEGAVSWTKVSDGTTINFTTSWNPMGSQLKLAAQGLQENTQYRIKINAQLAKDISGGEDGTGAKLDAQFNDLFHNGTGGEPGDDIDFTFQCSQCHLLLGLTSVAVPIPPDDTLLTWAIFVDVPVLEGQVPVFQIPADPVLTGLHVYGQVYMWNPYDFPADPIQLSNGLDATLGSASMPVPYGPASGINLWATAPTPLGGQLVMDFDVLGI